MPAAASSRPWPLRLVPPITAPTVAHHGLAAPAAWRQGPSTMLK